MKQDYLAIIETHLQGIPCKLGVTSFHEQKPCPWTWDSDLDYYGYTEMEYELLDRKGYLAPWLERKATDKDRDRFEEEIKQFRSQEREFI